jgi:FkbH-like protein
MFSNIWSDKLKTNEDALYNKSHFNHLIQGKSLILWREHCVECSMPLCYKSCSLFVERKDKRCARFINGIQRVNNGNGGEIDFRRWAKLECQLSPNFGTLNLTLYSFLDSIFYIFGLFFKKISFLTTFYRLSELFAGFHERFIYLISNQIKFSKPNYFLTEFFSFQEVKTKMHLEIISDGLTTFRKSIDINIGYNSVLIDIKEFNFENITNKSYFRIWFDNERNLKIKFNHLNFVRFLNKSSIKTNLILPADKIKCVAWDLDDTLWKGVIGDLGIDGVIPNKAALRLISHFDDIGILQTIVSKNDFDIAWPMIEKLQLENMFLYPAINWGRKSQSLITISKALNIGLDSFAVIDDSVFERNEITESLNQVRVYHPNEINDILSRDEFKLIVSNESKNRRNSYLTEYKRKNIESSWDGDYISFLKSCSLSLNVFKPLKPDDIRRCLELLLRSNQYNLSTKRYNENSFDERLNDKMYLNFGFDVSDNFGSYGIVGFVSVNIKEDFVIEDLVMSCRVAQKHIENEFIAWFYNNYCLNINKSLIIKMIKSDRNSPLLQSFDSMSLLRYGETNELVYFKLDSKEKISNKIVSINLIH